MFALIPLDRPVLVLCLVGASALSHAQNTPNKTLGDLIEQAKREQALALNPVPKPAALPSKKPLPVALNVLGTPKKNKGPILWSLTGMNHQLVAEIIHEEQVHVLRLSEGDRVIGPWVIERYGVTGLHLTYATEAAHQTPKTLFLPAPSLGTSLDKFSSALPSDKVISSTNRARDGTGDLNTAQDVSDIMPPQMLDSFNTTAADTTNPTKPPAPR